MNRSIEHQDASANMPVGVFLGDELLAVVPDDGSDPYGYDTVKRLAAERGVSTHGFEVLLLCRRHPDRSAVDCVDCAPLD